MEWERESCPPRGWSKASGREQRAGPGRKGRMWAEEMSLGGIPDGRNTGAQEEKFREDRDP